MPSTSLNRQHVTWLLVLFLGLLVGATGWFYLLQPPSVSNKTGEFSIPANLNSMRLLAKDFDLASTPDDAAKVSARADSTFAKVESEIKAAMAVAPELDVAVAYRDLATGVYRGINDLEVMPTGSLVKVALMVATLKKIEAHPELNQVLITYDASKLPPIRVWDLPFFHPSPLREIYDQHSYSLDQLLYKMAALSSNRVAALLYDFVKPEFEKLYTDVGLKPPALELPSRDAKDSLVGFELLFNGKYLSESSSRKAMYILSHSDFDAGLQGLLPRSVRMAHKFGTNLDDRGTYWLHECGVVYTERPYDLCIFTRGPNLYEMRDLIQVISKFIYDGQVSTTSGVH